MCFEFLKKLLFFCLTADLMADLDSYDSQMKSFVRPVKSPSRYFTSTCRYIAPN